MARFQVKFIVKREDDTQGQETYHPLIVANSCELATKHFLYMARDTKLAGFSIQEVDSEGKPLEFDT